jgi:Ca-activated chloride channel family protein
LLTNREPGKDGYFLMLLSPKSDLKSTEREAKDIIFVLDTSGSMSGEKIDKAKSALRFGVDSLFDDDRFNIVSFSGEEHLMATGLVQATKEGKQKGHAFIEHLRAEGGTNINDALVTALKQLGPAGRTQMVVMITDGLPTVGITDINKICDNIIKENGGRARLFCFGVGYDVNTTLLDRLSLDNRGTTDYIEPAEDLEVKVSSFFAKVNYPVLTDLHLDLGGVQSDMVYPRALPDLFKGSQLVLVGRYKDSASNSTVRLKGKIGGKERSFSFAGQSFPQETSQNEFLPRLWATRRVGYLLEQIRLNGANKELVDEITSLGTRYGIVTPYTSFLITEDAKFKESYWRRTPRGNVAPGDRVSSIGGVYSATEATGEKAVARSRAEKDYATEEQVVTPDQYLRDIRTVGAKTFQLKNGVWTDTEFNESSNLPKVSLKFGSEEYFKLVIEQPKLAEFLSVGERVIVVFNSKIYRVD